MPLPEHPEELILPMRDGSRRALGVDLLPDARAGLLLQQRLQGRDLRGDRGRLPLPWAR